MAKRKIKMAMSMALWPRFFGAGGGMMGAGSGSSGNVPPREEKGRFKSSSTGSDVCEGGRSLVSWADARMSGIPGSRTSGKTQRVEVLFQSAFEKPPSLTCFKIYLSAFCILFVETCFIINEFPWYIGFR